MANDNHVSTIAVGMSFPLTVQSLDIQLKRLINWEPVAIHLPGIYKHHIDKIKANKPNDVDYQKLDLYEKWLQIHPQASWADVI